MKRALFMTVGTGIGDSKDGIHSLAHGLLYSIKHNRPDKIVFFGSELSKETVESVKKQYMDDLNEGFMENEFIKIENVDEFNHCFNQIKNKIEEYSDFEVIIDYTSGTKTMTMSAAICSLLYHKDLVLVYGDRGKNGLVTSQTEEMKTQNLYLVYDQILFEEVIKLFNHYRFQTAIETLEKTVSLEDKGPYLTLIKGYQAWDLFDHQKCKEYLTKPEVKKIGKIKDNVNQNLWIVGIISDPQQDNKSSYLVADLINNAVRRGEEKKYDDAVARLYRTIELIAQCILNDKYNLNTSSINRQQLSDLEKVQMFKNNKQDKIKIGLQDSYKLLRLRDEAIGEDFIEDNRMKDLLQKRNNSILAHGLETIPKEIYEELLSKTMEYASMVFTDLEDLMDKAKFPKL
ncbi:MAG: TIGR02710 family CRISPR-associated CARF protein [Methanomicrobiales archaeon]